MAAHLVHTTHDSGRDRTGGDLWAIAGLAVALLAFLLAPFVLDGFSFPLGPDAPVYLWWTRITEELGVSAAGERPGVPGLLLGLTETTSLPLVAIVAGVEVALGTVIGLLGAVLVRDRAGGREATGLWARPLWLLAGALAGVFSVHLVAGYVANLIFLIGFLAAAVCLLRRSRAAAWAGASVLGLTGLAHPYFFLIGLAVFGVTVLLTLREARSEARSEDDPDEVRRIAIVGLGGGVLLGIGMLTTLGVPRPPDVETSRDGLLRRAGLGAELASAYRERFVDRWARYVQWASLPLAVFGIGRVRGFLGRFLLAWAIVTVLGVIMGLATAWFPPDRFVTFGFAIPILAAFGVIRLVSLARGRWRVLAWATAGVLVIAMALGASFAWFRNEPYINEREVRAAETFGRVLDQRVATAATFPVEETGVPAPTFHLARAWNVVLASIPPDRIREVVPTFANTPDPVAERRAVSRVLARMLEERASIASGSTSNPPDLERHLIRAALRPFVVGVPWPFPAAPGGNPDVHVLQGPERPAPGRPRDPLERTSPAGIVAASLIVLLLLGALGFGWAGFADLGPVTRIAIAPAFGAAAAIGTALLRDTFWLDLHAGIATASGGVLGYLLLFLQRRRAAQAPEQIDEEP